MKEKIDQTPSLGGCAVLLSLRERVGVRASLEESTLSNERLS
jgi:hypothetical protein